MIEELRSDFCELVEMMRTDHIKLKKGRIRGLSPLWWIVRLGQFGFVCGCFYAMYCGLWLLVG